MRPLRLLFILAVLLALPDEIRPAPGPKTAAEQVAGRAALADQLTALLSRGTLDGIPRDHPLRPVAETPSLATFSYLLLGDDPVLLAESYPQIAQTVRAIFSAPNASAAGFVRGDRLGEGPIARPGLNALAALELHSLSLIAAAVGLAYDAVELRDWSYRHAEAVRGHFYDPASGTFQATAGADLFYPQYLPDQLLPFLVGRRTATAALSAAARNIRRQESSPGQTSYSASLWDDPAVRPMIVALLRGLDAAGIEDPASLLAVASPPAAPRLDPSPYSGWIAFWNSATNIWNRLRPASDDLFILTQLKQILEDEDLLTDEWRLKLAADLELLTQCLEGATVDLERQVVAIEASERLLAILSAMSEELATGQAWKIFERRPWNRISSRQRRIVVEGCRLSAEDLAAARRTVSQRLMRTTGIVAALSLPDRPVRAGEQVMLEVALGSAHMPLALESLALRAGGKRWLLGCAGDTLKIEPGAAPLRWSKMLPAAPDDQPGLHTIEACLEFVVAEGQVEICLAENAVLTPKYDVGLRFPRGRAIRDRFLPVEIILKHPSGKRAFGVVSGLFGEDFSCLPGLPAEFALREETDITILPLTIQAGEEVAPGRHPFSLSVTLDDAPIAAFEATLVRPMRWLHLGPLPAGDWLARNAIDLAGKLAAEHILPGGGSARWLEVPDGAFDAAGAILPLQLYGPSSEQGMLLYAAVTSPWQTVVRWRIAGDCVADLWINGLPLPAGAAAEPTAVLRAGRNSILIASNWSEPCGAILIEILDEGGLPPAQIRNATGEAVHDAARAHSTAADAPAPPEQPREVTFTLTHPQAREVALIGEFNGWSPEAAPMRRLEAGKWHTSVFLTPGTYSYKFLIDRRQRIVDPRAQKTEPDGLGGYNAVITVR